MSGLENIYFELKSLSDRLLSISITHPNLQSILLLITKEYEDLFKVQKEHHDNEMNQFKKNSDDIINKLKKNEENMKLKSSELDR